MIVKNHRKPFRKKSVVIIGANFAGLSAAGQLSGRYHVSVIDERAAFQWTPNIHEILSGVKRESSVNIDTARIIRRMGHRFINQRAVHIDVKNNWVELDDSSPQRFDALLIASGHVQSNRGVTGAEEYADGFLRADEVFNIRRKIARRLQAGQDTAVSIIGGGFTGVEVLGELLRSYRSEPRLTINVVDSASRLVSELPKVLADDIRRRCESEKVSFYFGKELREVDASGLRFQDGQTLCSDITIWSAGTLLPSFIEASGIQTVQQRGVPVNPCLQSTRYPQIFAAGDAASTPRPLAKQAGHAIDMGERAGTNIDRWLRGREMVSYRPANKPIALAFGDINTYLIQGETVLASPALVAAKEALYQAYMARLSSYLPLFELSSGVASRCYGAIRHLLLPEILSFRPLGILQRSQVLQWSGKA